MSLNVGFKASRRKMIGYGVFVGVGFYVLSAVMGSIDLSFEWINRCIWYITMHTSIILTSFQHALQYNHLVNFTHLPPVTLLLPIHFTSGSPIDKRELEPQSGRRLLPSAKA